MTITYGILRELCKSVINDNLATERLLSIKDFKDYNRFLRDASSLRFFRYCHISEHKWSDLINDTISCSKPQNVNDYFEGLVSSHEGEEWKTIKDIINKVRGAAYLTCFSESWDNLLMFAHYADSYKGFCLEYDFSNFLTNTPYPYFFPVIYQSQTSKLAGMKQLNHDIEQALAESKRSGSGFTKTDDIISYLIHKAKVWEYEREWRFIIPVSQYYNFFQTSTPDDHPSLSVPNCLTAVYVGADAIPETLNRVKEIVREKNKKRGNENQIKVYKTSIKPDTYELKAELCVF